MAKLKLYLDTRNKSNLHTIKISITHNYTREYILTKVRLSKEQWDNQTQKCINHNNAKYINTYLYHIMSEAENCLYNLQFKGIKIATALDIKKQIESALGIDSPKQNMLIDFATKVRASKEKIHTRENYTILIKNIIKVGDINIPEITEKYSERLYNHLVANYSINSANYIFVTYSSLMKLATKEGLLSNFWTIKKKKKTPTKKRNLPLQDLRNFLTAEVHPKSQVAADIMRLQFYLIGINSADLVKIKKIENGRIEYIRSKTGVQYSIKVEPEAKAILDKYTNDKGEISITIPSVKILKPNKEELHKGVTSYWMRHSWASIASEIDIPIETISKALGHNIGVSVTHIYINFNSKKIDEANRKVIDYVLYGKK